MEYRRLGNSGTIVTAWCLGTMTFGAEADEAASFEITDAYAAAGGNFFDTADVYSTGASETIIGRWLKARPTEAAQMVIATKARFPMGPGPNDIGLSRRHLASALEAVAKARGVSMAEVALAWCVARPAVTSVILGARTTAQLAENLRADGLKLSAEETAALDAAGAPQIGDYPYGVGGRNQRYRKIEGGR